MLWSGPWLWVIFQYRRSTAIFYWGFSAMKTTGLECLARLSFASASDAVRKFSVFLAGQLARRNRPFDPLKVSDLNIQEADR